MKKAILLLMGLFSVVMIRSQVGVNTQSPKSTFHVVPIKTDGTTAEGIIAPNLSRAELIGKDSRYGSDQRGAIVYVTAVDGTVNTKTSKITEVGYYYFDGNAWQPFTSQAVTIPTEPWLVQGGTTQATGNAQDIYQTGKVAIGTGATAASAYNLEVAGTSYVSGNSRVGSSTVTGAQSVAGNHTVAGTTTLNGATNAKATTITGQLRYTIGAPATNKVLISSDANGNATWATAQSLITIPTEPWRVQGGATAATANTQDIYQTGKVAIGTGATATSAYNLEVAGSSYISGNSRVGSNTVIGAQTVGTTLGVTGAATMSNNLTVAGTTNLNGTTNAKATNVSGTFNYKPGGTAPAANTYLRTDAAGNASWQALPAYPVIPTEPWLVQGGTAQATGNAQNIYQTGSVHVGANTAVTAYKFQVTGASNITGNSRVGSSTVAGAQTVAGNQTVSGTMTAGSATALPTGALLGVQTTAPNAGVANSTKGFMYPRLTLAGAVSLAPMVASGGTAAEKLQHKGLTVYHLGGNNLPQGLYFWDGIQWLKIITDIPPAPVITSNIHNLLQTYQCPNNAEATIPMQFGTLQANGTYAIEIKEKGSYMFSLRLYGRSTILPAPTGNINFYTWLYADGVVIDAVEYPITTSSYYYNATTNQYAHYTGITLNLSAKDINVGTKITIAMNSGTFRYYDATKASKHVTTSMVNWLWNIGAGVTPVRSSLVYYKL